jgi:o-succinylbenzoate synthase
MIQIQKFILREITLPLREPFRISSGESTVRRIVLVELHTGDGHHAWAECVAGTEPNYSPETVDTAWMAIRDWVAPRVLGIPFDHPAALHPVLDRDFRGHRMAKAAIEMGAWCLGAELAGQSLSRYLGGTRDEIEVGISLGIQSRPQDLAERAARALSDGFRKIKLKIMPGSDVAYVRAAREALGPAAPLMVDANNAYTLHDIERLRELDQFALLMIEQPLAWDDILRHATLQKALTTPICLDESITSRDRADDMIALAAGKIVNIKAGRVGGFTESKAIHDLCATHGIPVWCGGMLESGIGRAYNVALASLPNFSIPGDLSPSARYWERDIVVPEWTMSRDGLVTVPRDAPGLGVSIDLDRVDNLTVRHETLAAR